MVEYLLEYPNKQIPDIIRTIKIGYRFKDTEKDYRITRSNQGFFLHAEESESLGRRVQEGFGEVVRQYGSTIIDYLQLVRVMPHPFTRGYIPHREQVNNFKEALQQLK